MVCPQNGTAVLKYFCFSVPSVKVVVPTAVYLILYHRSALFFFCGNARYCFHGGCRLMVLLYFRVLVHDSLGARSNLDEPFLGLQSRFGDKTLRI